MKKIKIKQRIENAFDAFFENENSAGDSAMAITVNHELVRTLNESPLALAADKYFDYFKKIFVFAPGVLFLHLAVPATLEFGFGLWGLFWLAAGIFMVWAGIGDLRNKKHFLLPTSVMVTALLFAVPFAILPLNLLGYYIYFYIGILPLLFIAPILTKGALEKNEASKN